MNDRDLKVDVLEQLDLGEVLETAAHHCRLLGASELSGVTGGRAQLSTMMAAESTPSCSPCADDCQD